MTQAELLDLRTDAIDLGRLADLTFSTARVVSTPGAEQACGGVVQGSWLLAVQACDVDGTARPTLLLRVGTSAPAKSEEDDGYRVYGCEVIGVFGLYDGRAVFSAQVDSIGLPSEYRVFVPSAAAMSQIASFSTDPNPHQLRIGVLRFSPARLAAARSGRDAAAVNVNVNDFVGRRTAVFGITRSGKSSTIKTLASAIVKQSAMSGTKVGQIIFDPQGEYAEVNAQDGTALRLLGDEDQVRIYRSVIDPTNPQDRRLLFNFFDHGLLDVAWDIVKDYMHDAPTLSTQSFCSVMMDEPDFATRNADWLAWSRSRLAFYALIHQSGFTGIFPDRSPVWFTMSEAASSAYRQEHLYAGSTHLLPHQDSKNPLLWAAVNPEQCSAVTDWFMARAESMARDITNAVSQTDRDRATKRMRDILGDGIGAWDDPSTGFWSIAQMTRPANGDALSHLRPLIEVHDPEGREDVTAQVWEDMVEGRLVVIDLSVGSESVTRLMSERIANRLLTEASAVFRAGEDPVRFQMVVEEAHNLFERGRMATEDPWVRIAKEGAKYGIGLIYATQEVTSIDQRILANTHNWVVAHLNSANEIAELAKYYDFATFAESIRRSEDVGYVRLKTLSSPFIVPIQFDRFDSHAIDAARAAQGLAPLDAVPPVVIEPVQILAAPVAPVIVQPALQPEQAAQSAFAPSPDVVASERELVPVG